MLGWLLLKTNCPEVTNELVEIWGISSFWEDSIYLSFITYALLSCLIRSSPESASAGELREDIPTGRTGGKGKQMLFERKFRSND